MRLLALEIPEVLLRLVASVGACPDTGRDRRKQDGGQRPPLQKISAMQGAE
jgi:hypothetical protein